MDNLKPCPMCGSTQINVHEDNRFRYVRCLHCGLNQRRALGVDIIGVWNKRHSTTVALSESVDIVKAHLSHVFTEIAKRNVGNLIKDIPEMAELLTTIKLIEKLKHE